MTLKEFTERVGKIAKEKYEQYKILPSLCIAQALLESNKADYRKGMLTLSGLAIDCNNFFGMKWRKGCGCEYKEYDTKEQSSSGAYYTVKARFRKYDTLEEGIEGYFKFLQYPRYKNLKGIKDYKLACNLIREDGWATSLTYTQNLIKRIEVLQLFEYDKTLIVLESGVKNMILKTLSIEKNRKDIQVSMLQGILTAKKYDVGKIDGIYGKQTENAVEVLQRETMIKEDGICGNETWSALGVS